MLGVGCGFDTMGANLPIPIRGLNSSKPSRKFVLCFNPSLSLLSPYFFICNMKIYSFRHNIEDSRDGWVKSVQSLIDAYYNFEAPIEFDYSKIRAGF